MDMEFNKHELRGIRRHERREKRTYREQSEMPRGNRRQIIEQLEEEDFQDELEEAGA